MAALAMPTWYDQLQKRLTRFRNGRLLRSMYADAVEVQSLAVSHSQNNNYTL